MILLYVIEAGRKNFRLFYVVIVAILYNFYQASCPFKIKAGIYARPIISC